LKLEELFGRIIQELNKGNPVAIATIIGKEGSGPREIGASMVVTVDGERIGTIGGGELEAIIIRNALEAIEKGEPRKIKLALRRDNIPSDAQPTGMLCGGVVEVFINVLKPQPRVVIIGAGHLGKPIAEIGNLLGFRTVIMDRSEELANPMRYPFAEQVFAGDFLSELEKIRLGPNDIAVIVYGEVETDYQSLKKILQYNPSRHVWVLCSRHRARWMVERLREEGVDVEKHKFFIHMPAGLDIKSATPEEIAVSIWSEVICVLKNCEIPVKTLSIFKEV
jgi:xanthine dehydrogenase accessory factor